MYRLSPFTYLIDGMLSVGIANTYAYCKDYEFLHFEPPSNQTCQAYLSNYISVYGGYVGNPAATADCQYCTIYETNVFLSSISSSYENRWRNFGILWGFIIFNVFGAIGLYWLARVPKKSGKKEKAE
jgi:ATP-binding cassette subfamily G (WHITE) protein 2 (PDR)